MDGWMFSLFTWKVVLLDKVPRGNILLFVQHIVLIIKKVYNLDQCAVVLAGFLMCLSLLFCCLGCSPSFESRLWGKGVYSNSVFVTQCSTQRSPQRLI